MKERKVGGMSLLSRTLRASVKVICYAKEVPFGLVVGLTRDFHFEFY